MAFKVSISPSKLAISWFSSSVEWEGCKRCTSSAVWGGGLVGLIREGGVPDDNVLELLPAGFLYGDDVGLTVTKITNKQTLRPLRAKKP